MPMEHGLVPIAEELSIQGVDWLGVALVEEGLRLREAGIRTPILVVGGALEGCLDVLVKSLLTPALFRVEHIRELAIASAGKPTAFHLKIDTGMARLGISVAELPQFLEKLAPYPHLRLDGILTHFANADLADRSFNEHQLALFKQAHALLSQRGYQPRWVHIANSAAVLTFPEAHQVLVRPGLMLYGLDPMQERTTASLKPAMRWVTRPVHVKTIPKGSRVSYGGRFVALRDSCIITLPVGYADGYSRSLSNKAQVLIRGQRANIVGTICMDLCMADVTDIPHVSINDEVVLMGCQGQDEISAYELSRWAGTIPYEIVCNVSARVPRQYVDSQA